MLGLLLCVCCVVLCCVVLCCVVLCCVVWSGVVWCGVVWCGVVWCGVVWCGVVWCGLVWCGVVWCGVVWCGVVWCGVVWCGVVWCGVVWCGVVWCGVVLCGVVWCGVVWCGVVWCGVVWRCGVWRCAVVVLWCVVLWVLCALCCICCKTPEKRDNMDKKQGLPPKKDPLGPWRTKNFHLLGPSTFFTRVRLAEVDCDGSVSHVSSSASCSAPLSPQQWTLGLAASLSEDVRVKFEEWYNSVEIEAKASVDPYLEVLSQGSPGTSVPADPVSSTPIAVTSKGSAFRASKAPFPSRRAAPYAAGFQMSKSQERPPGADQIVNAVAQPLLDADV